MDENKSEQERYKSKLREDRKDSARIFEKSSMRGIKDSVVEKYSDQAHFIYELIQNADDAGATKATFELYNDKVIFIHNGTRHFNITNPETEEEDRAAGKLGSVNAITAIGNSAKAKDEATIGKFGVGFKAVFQYTDTPYIFDRDIAFKLENMIVPEWLETGYDGVDIDYTKTTFVLPFNHGVVKAADAERDIAEKLKALVYPTLYLRNLREVSYTHGSTQGLYKKVSKRHLEYDGDLSVNLYELVHSYENERAVERMWCFDKKLANNLNISVGFFEDATGKIEPRKLAAFCFFPTKADTGLNFAINAPFLLTDSREGIKVNSEHNHRMIDELAILATRAIQLFPEISTIQKRIYVDDEFIQNIIPYDPDIFRPADDKDEISFIPFYEHIKRLLETEKILPVGNGELGYSYAGDAYWANSARIPLFLTNKQLGDLLQHPGANWVLTSFSRTEFQRGNGEALVEYMDDIIMDNVGNDDVVESLDSTFIKKQTDNWLIQLYEWLNRADVHQDLRMKDIYITDKNRVVPAFDESGHEILFMPSDARGYAVVKPSVLNEKTTKFFKEKLGLSEPSPRDEIFTKIIPRYGKEEISEAEKLRHAKKFVDFYFSGSSDDLTRLQEEIKNLDFIKYTSNQGDGFASAGELYFANEDLRKYFLVKNDTKYVDLDYYKQALAAKKFEQFKGLLSVIGVEDKARRLNEQVSIWDLKGYIPANLSRHKREAWFIVYIDGLEENLDAIQAGDSERSLMLWEQLKSADPEDYCGRLPQAVFAWATAYQQEFELLDNSPLREKILTTPWMLDADGNLRAPQDLNTNTLAESYRKDLTPEQFSAMTQWLGIRDIDIDKNLTAEQQDGLEFYRLAQKYGYTVDDLKKWHDRKVARERRKQEESEEYINGFSDKGEISDYRKDLAAAILTGQVEDDDANESSEPEESTISYEETGIDPRANERGFSLANLSAEMQDKLAREEYVQELRDKIEAMPKYSFGWFKALLQLEIALTTTESNRRDVSITFAKVSLKPDTTRTLVLEHPNRLIPTSIEDVPNIPLEIVTVDNQKFKCVLETVSVKPNLVEARVKPGKEIPDEIFCQVAKATISVSDISFLKDKLSERFFALGLDDNYDMRQHLCQNIEFIFGPPGTGKTTYLAREVIEPLVEQNDELRVLVLTPTNQSADVLVEKIMRSARDKGESCGDWLVRFGNTGREKIIEEGIFRDKTFDIEALDKAVVVTTMARFPYDFFMPDGARRLNIADLSWDYIIIDEASMIPLVEIMLPLYKKTPAQFIIAGDPHQIEPITTASEWAGENIYKLVGLNSFAHPKTTPHDYPITLLDTQYRSIPTLGEICSRYLYDGALKHHRDDADISTLCADDRFDFKPINIINYPVRDYEGIYRPNAVKGSSYHIYSAIFTCELVSYLASEVAMVNAEEKYHIGIISPYRTQSDILERIIGRMKLPRNVQVSVGTVHRFQGDECEVIIAMMNSPKSIGANALINDENLLNVATSRAKDYLFFISPDDDTKNLYRIENFNRLKGLLKASDAVGIYDMRDLERELLGEDDFIENHSFTTGHQNVNIYDEPEAIYEIRADDDALDIQINR